METFNASNNKSECNTRELCYVFASLHLMGNCCGCIYYFVCCILESSDEKKSFGAAYNPYGSFSTFLMLSICFGIVFYKNLSLIDGLRKDSQASIAVFIIIIQCLFVILGFRVYYAYIARPDGTLPLIVCLDVCYMAFIIISLMPFYIQYNRMKSEFYVPQMIQFSCCKSDTASRATEVPTYEI